MKLISFLLVLTSAIYAYVATAPLPAPLKPSLTKHGVAAAPGIVSLQDALCGKRWQLKEIRFLQDNENYFYKRGSDDNSINFDTEYIEFYPDHTGTYHAGGILYKVDWQDIENNVLRYTVHYPTPLHVTWEQLDTAHGDLRYTEYYTRKRTESLASATRFASGESALYVNP